MTIYKNLGKNVVEKRTAIGWTQEDLAYHADLTVSSISKIERGITNPTLWTLDRIADALGIETDE